MQHARPFTSSRRLSRALFLAGVLALVLSPQAVLAQASGENATDSGLVPELVEEATPLNLPTAIVDFFRALDWWTIPFAMVTLVGLWVTVDRMVVLRRGRVIPKPFVKRFLKLLEDGELDPAEALQICEDNDSPVAHVFAHGIRKWGKPSVEVEQAIIDGGERQVSALRNHLRMLNGVATISPLLGLLGTVWGMLHAFKDISGPNRAANMPELSANIALALVTTAAGLMIAIPALVIYMWLSGRVDSLVMEMDELSQRVVHCVSAEALAERAARPRRAAKVEKPIVEEPAKKRAV